MADEARREHQAQPEGQADTTQSRTWVEEVEVAGNQLIERIQALVRDGNAKRVIIRTSDGSELMTLPLTIGVAAGGLITLAAPMLAALGAMAGLVSRVTLEIERVAPAPEAGEHEAPVATLGETPDDARHEGEVAS